MMAYSPSATCECGCGRPVSIADRDNTKRGWVKGQPRRFSKGHGTRMQHPPKNGYRAIGTSPTTKEYLHVVIAERALGRPMRRPEEVHHVDENKLNNANTNLVICQDRAYHALLHYRAKILRAGGDPNTQRLCITCRRLKSASEFSPLKDGGYHGQCRECARAYWRFNNQFRGKLVSE